MPRSHRAIEGLQAFGAEYWHLTAPALYEEAARRREGLIADQGPLVVGTGRRTGRSPKDKYIVREPGTADQIAWGEVNRPMSPEQFDALYDRTIAYLQGQDRFIQDVYAGADRRYRLPVRVITEFAWHSLFARNLFIPETDPEALAAFEPAFRVVCAPGFKADPVRDGTHSEVCVVIHFARKLVLIVGTEYAGEIKKSIFTVMNVLLPARGILPMHASANTNPKGQDVAVFFGLSGTGKTTLSAEAGRVLIGDDEHGWSDDGVFNLEGGCYAKVIRLSPKGEPEIYATTRRFGTVLENVVIDPLTRRMDLDDESITENTRAAYPLDFIPNASPTGLAGTPKTIVMLSCDAFGVLPAVARLTPEQAMYYFLLGYTARVAGTEAGVTEPQAVFSTCFGAPFMALAPEVYARMLRERIAKSGAHVWLVNTGWVGGKAGVAERMPLNETRAVIAGIHSGQLAQVPTVTDPIFGFAVPQSCPGVDAKHLNVKAAWADASAYDATAKDLAERFHKAFQVYAANVDEAIRQAGPRLAVPTS